ncbi:MAG: outer membrane protein assembly factor BamD [Terriglobia bacterium]
MRRPLSGIFVLILTVPFLSGCLFRRHGDDAGLVNPGDQPDKILYEKATREIEKGRFDVGRLTLQTLINTYPDSEFLSKSKLAIADSYYNEGGVSGLTQAEAEYRDFITFFPTAPEAPDAQYKAGMAHYRMMAKADRDRTEAKLAEAEFKEFLLKYPDSQTMPRVKRRLREVQEVLAQGDFKIARYYYSKGAMRAAQSRFQEIADSYPDFSRVDNALWHLGQSLERLRRANEAAPYYARIVTDHPLSPLVEDAKERLTALHQPIPRPTRAMLARAQADAARRPGKDLFQKMGNFLSSGPDTSATRRGPVRLGGPKPSEVEVAKGPEPAPGASSIVVQPVGEDSLKAGKPIGSTDPKPAGSEGASASTPNSAEGQKPAANSNGSNTQISEPAPPPKKKAKRGLLKRIIKPF